MLTPDKEEIYLKRLLAAVASALIFFVIIILAFLCCVGCTELPQLAQAVDDIETDTAIRIEVDKEAINKQTDVEVKVSIKNKDNQNAIR
jgi:archaellum component FlaG (FlaF/FlaG flagellin family)